MITLICISFYFTHRKINTSRLSMTSLNICHIIFLRMSFFFGLPADYYFLRTVITMPVWCLQSPTLRQLLSQTCHSGNDGPATFWKNKLEPLQGRLCGQAEMLEKDVEVGPGQRVLMGLWSVWSVGEDFKEWKSFLEDTCFLLVFQFKSNCLIITPVEVIITLIPRPDMGDSNCTWVKGLLSAF